MNEIIIYSAPPELTDAEAQFLAEAWKCNEVVSGWTPHNELKPGALHFTTYRYEEIVKLLANGRKLLPYKLAMIIARKVKE